jgi:hypothetical protein
MGSQQLLLLVLIVIVVSLAVMLAIYMFNDNAASANLDRVCGFLTELAASAQKHYTRPIWMDGGSHSFSRLTADAQGIAFLTNKPELAIGTFSILVSGTDTKVTLQGIGVEDGDKDGIDCTVTCDVYADSIRTVIVNR